jgi:hypothetical protein
MPMRAALSPIVVLAGTLALLAAAAPARAAEAQKDADAPDQVILAGTPEGMRDFTTDRPDVTESPYTIDPGHIQIETTLLGYTRSRRDAAGVVTDSYELGTTNLRVGVTDRMEFDLVWQPYGIADPRGGGVTQRGIGSVTLRAKYNLWGNDGPSKPGDTALALLPYVTIPTDRSNGISDSEASFGLIVPVALELGGGFGLGLNAAANFTRESSAAPYDAAILTSASLGYEWNDTLASYAEVVWEFSRGGQGDAVTLDTGLTIALAKNWQFDMGVNIGATRAADPIQPFIGLSARF